MASSSFSDDVRSVLSDTMNLPQEFKDWLIQHNALNPVPLAKTFNVRGIYRKSTSKQVVSTVTETDLLNGEIVVTPNALGTTGVLRLTAWGDAINNTGVGQNFPRFKVKLGSTTLIDSGLVNQWASATGRFMWRAQVEIANLSSTNSQWVTLIQELAGANIGATAAAGATTGEGNVNVQTLINQGRIVEANSGAVDTTVSQTLAYTVTLPVSNANLDWTLKGALVEIT